MDGRKEESNKFFLNVITTAREFSPASSNSMAGLGVSTPLTCLTTEMSASALKAATSSSVLWEADGGWR